MLVFIFAIFLLFKTYGRKSMFQASVYVTTEMIVSIETLPAMAQRTMDLLCAMHGRIKKCLILDLDNTMWGGIIGDDGMENIQVGTLGIGKAFTEFQYWLKKLKDRGVHSRYMQQEYRIHCQGGF
jgi:predicted enzyme involved in methoxymalonyl-ACP biosynthesis